MTMTEELPVLHGSAAQSFAYFGHREGWLIALSVNRDSDTIERSNWEVISEHLIREYGDDVAIERMHHWAVGWVDYLLVRPDNADAVKAAKEWKARLANYPIADEEHHSMLEYDEEWCVRCDRGMRKEHPGDGYICRKFRSEEDASEIGWKWRTRRER